MLINYRWIFALAVKVWGLVFTSVKYTFFLCEHSLKRIWQLKFHTFYDANDQTWDKNELRQRQIRLSHPTSKSEVKVPLFWNVYAVLLVPPGVRLSNVCSPYLKIETGANLQSKFNNIVEAITCLAKRSILWWCRGWTLSY